MKKLKNIKISRYSKKINNNKIAKDRIGHFFRVGGPSLKCNYLTVNLNFVKKKKKRFPLSTINKKIPVSIWFIVREIK